MWAVLKTQKSYLVLDEAVTSFEVILAILRQAAVVSLNEPSV